jgi:hypothetical protein
MPVRTAIMDPEIDPEPESRRLPLIAEVLGYLGAATALSAAFVVVRQVWPKIPPAGILSCAAIAAVALVAAGLALHRRSHEPPFARLRSVLWLLATVAAGGFFAVLAGQVLKLHSGEVALASEAGWTACALALWLRGRSALLHLAMFGGAVALAGTGLYQLNPNSTSTEIGLVIWALSVAWGLAAYLGYLAPATAGLAAGSAGAIVGSALMSGPAGQVLALVTVGALLAAGVLSRRVLLVGFGAAGALWTIPETVDRYLPGTVAAPLAVAVVGLILLGVALWLGWNRRRA